MKFQTLLFFGKENTMSQRSRIERRNRCVSGLRGVLNMTLGGASSTHAPRALAALRNSVISLLRSKVGRILLMGSGTMARLSRVPSN
jgi:hypothetical protein